MPGKTRLSHVEKFPRRTDVTLSKQSNAQLLAQCHHTNYDCWYHVAELPQARFSYQLSCCVDEILSSATQLRTTDYDKQIVPANRFAVTCVCATLFGAWYVWLRHNDRSVRHSMSLHAAFEIVLDSKISRSGAWQLQWPMISGSIWLLIRVPR